jgi:hypothetical protein
LQKDLDAPWRPLIDREGAQAVLDRLLAREPTDAEPPTEELEELVQLPSLSTAPLHLRALLSPDTLSGKHRVLMEQARRAYFGELSAALGMSKRGLIRLVRNGQPLAAPRTIADYDYEGSFESGGEVNVCDPCYLGRKEKLPTLPLRVKAGCWHIYIRYGSGRDEDVPEELAVMHEQGFDTPAMREAGFIGVDAGLAGVFDAACPRPDLDKGEAQQGPFGGRGAISSSGYGDGGYSVLTGSLDGQVVKIRIVFIGGSSRADPTLLAAPSGEPGQDAQALERPVRAYSPKERFAPNDVVEHKKFGIGTVVELTPGDSGKIKVAFPDGERTLIHGRE